MAGGRIGYSAGMVTEARAKRIAEMARRRQAGVVVLEDIHDPNNAAAVFRTCEFLGFHHIWLIFEREPRFDPLQARGPGVSAERWLRFEVFDSTAGCLAALREAGQTTVATALESPGAESIYEAAWPMAKLALLLGNEHRGLSETALRGADYHLTLPPQGMVQSLNLSVTAAICLYELTRQRTTRGMQAYGVSDAERREIEQRTIEAQHRGKPETPAPLPGQRQQDRG
jgi:tRNA (guanosine-2'-O-)-methyltransferase